MKKYLLGLLVLGILAPFFSGVVNADPNGRVLGGPVSKSDWIEERGCTDILDSYVCDYTEPAKALRLGYEYKFADEFWAGNKKRLLKKACVRFSEPEDYGDYNNGDNPKFQRTQELIDSDYRVQKNKSMVVIMADRLYKIKSIPENRSSDNLFVKYVIEYADDTAATTRYQHTECYSYEISRCGDGKVDTDWVGKPDNVPGEVCDPGDPSHKNRGAGGCDEDTCQPITSVVSPKCNGSYTGSRYNVNYPTPMLNSSMTNLCSEGTLTSFSGPTEPGRTYTWKCNGVAGTTPASCNAKELWCGDGTVNGTEECDGNSGSNWVCNSSCKKEAKPQDPKCNGSYTGSRYNVNYPTPMLNSSMTNLCSEGTLTSFSGPTEPGRTYTWKCNGVAGTTPASCNAKELWCGDGTVNGTEECDGNSGSNWVCNSSCKKEAKPQDPKCNGSYTGSRYNVNYPTPMLNSSMTNLCSEGTLTSFSGPTEPGRTYTWKCNGVAGTTPASCNAKELWCGDGTVNGTEECDGNSGSNWVCNSSCKKEAKPQDPKCNGSYTGSRYNVNYPTPLLNSSMTYLCSEGTLTSFSGPIGTGRTYTWKCNGVAGTTPASCNAKELWCGDGTVNGTEECDGTEGCSLSCKKVSQSEDCDQTFTGELRLGYNEPFTDTFNAGWLDRYLYYKEVVFKENHGNYDNKSSNPEFNWTSELVNHGMKVDANTSMVVIESEPYHIVSAPSTRAWNNLYIEYTIWHDNVKHSTTPSKSNLDSHKECAYYEISRCGDGVLDTKYGEACDPKDTSHTGRGSGGCDENTCQPITSVVSPKCNSDYNGQTLSNLVEGNYLCTVGTVSDFKYNANTDKWTWKCNNAGSSVDCYANKPQDGNLRIEKTLTGKKTVENTGEILTWQVRVRSEGGESTDFEIQDIVPFALSYEGYRVLKNNDNLQLPNKPSGPVHTATGNVYTWNVTGTLQKNHELILEIKTKVEKMPEAEDDYRNVACVIKGNDKKCDDDEPETGIPVIEKTLTGKKIVESTGEILTWEVKVTASGGNVTNFEIQDIVPFALSYEGYRVLKNNDNLQLPNKPSGPVHTATGNVYTWNVTGTLQKNHELILEIKTKVEKMPEAEDDYRNVACVIKGNNKKCDDDKPSGSPNLRIKKSFTDNTKHKVVKSGDLIAYKVRFGNSGDAQAKITSIKDFLPKNVKYITGSIHINRTSTHSHGTQSGEMNLINGFNVVDGVRIEIYGGMILQPGDEGYIILTGQVTSKFTGNRTNFACIYLNDTLIDCDDAKHDIKKQENVSCKPALSPSSFDDVCYGDAGEFSTTVTCKASENSDIEIRCDGNLIKSATNVEQITGTCSSDEHNKYHKVQCKINGSFTGINGEVCENSFRRDTKDCSSTCFVAGTKVTMADGSQKNIEDVEIGEKILGSNGTINTVLGYDRPVLGNRHLWSINGSEYFVSDEHPFMTTEGWKSFNPEMTKLEVNLNTTELKIGDVLVTDNGLEVIESVDYINADYNTPLYNFMLDGDHTYYANNYLVHNKGIDPKPDPDPESYCDKHPDNPMCELANPKCFNVNEGNFSIESGEYLPFYFNVYKEADATHKYKFIQNKDDECELGTVDLGSLKCEYKILDPYNNIVYSEDNIDCLQPGEDRVSSKPLIDAWKEKQTYLYTIDVDDTGLLYWPTISRTRSREWNTTVLGEYKFQLVVYQYDQCDDGGNWKTYTMDDPVCQSNFVLTDSYTVQKTPSGNLTASTNTLKKFREADGTHVEFSTYLNTISTSDYNPNGKVEEAMKAFSDKYEKLAVTVNKNGKTMKKVPGKNIYFIDGDFSIQNGTFSKPFTLVQTNPDKTIKIEGDITNLNMMILTEGDIEFIGNCEENQNVKGIFYAKGDLKRSGVKKNNNLSNNVWCTKGGLNIKGVLIGYNFNELMNKSRSHLEKWFESKGHNQELTKKIMNGASVVVEYSPSIFTKSTMPPGAEDFTTALSIYKN